jgi:hypothetical protein
VATITLPDNANVSAILFLAGADPFSSTYQGDGIHVSGITQETLDAALATYLSNEEDYLLGPARLGHSKHFAEQVVKEIESRYSTFRRELFLALYVEAIADGLTNRAAYINQLLTWVKQSVAVCIQYELDLDAASTFEEILVVSDGSGQLAVIMASDPESTIKGALAIED